MTAREEIQRLFERLANGQRAAIAPAYSILRPLVRKYCARALQNDADAEDVTQKTLIKVFDRVPSFDASRDGLAWVLTVASYECRTVYRRTCRRREDAFEGHDAVCPSVQVTPEDLLIEQDLRAAAGEVLLELGETDVVTIMAAIEEQRPTDATFRKRLQRALRRFRSAWRAKHDTDQKRRSGFVERRRVGSGSP
jgi:RNA polymerase sigma-70 factor (ECF subfamily)